MLVVIPASVGMWTLAAPISGVLYGTMKAAPVIAHLAPSIAFLGIFQVTTGALQGIGKTAIPMCNMLLGGVLKAVAAWQLTSFPAFHILGAAWASNLNFAFVAFVNIFFLYKNKISFPVSDCLKILAASLCMGAAGAGTAQFLSGKTGLVFVLLAAMAVSAFVYAVAVTALGCVTREEARQLPVIGKFLKK